MPAAARRVEPEPPAPEPAPDPVIRQAGEIRRVSRQDLDTLRPWLARRLRELYAQSSEPTIFSFLVASTTDNECWFVRNDRAIGLATVSRDALRRAKVEEQFVLALDYEGRERFSEPADIPDIDADDAATSLYPAMIAWARGRDATKAAVLIYSDAYHESVQKVVPGMGTREYFVVPMG